MISNNRFFKFFHIVLVPVILFVACSSNNDATDDNNAPESRSFKMGFTPWLYAATLDAQALTYNRLANYGDMVKHHLQGGIPWEEAFNNTEYSNHLEVNISGRLSNTASNLSVFLAIDSLNTARDGRALYWGDGENQPLPEVWVTRSWQSIEVITAYTNFATDMIQRFQPDYFEYGTEVSELILNDPAAYNDYLVFAEQVYTTLKSRFPSLKLVTSVALKSPSSLAMTQIAADYPALLPYTDVVGISTYPYVFYDHNDRGNPDNLPANWLSQIVSIIGDKPLAISETGWIGESLTIEEFQYAETSNPSFQNRFCEILMTEAETLNAEFVIWWTVADFDTLWNAELAQSPLAKIWKDIGLFDENQQARPALSTWQTWLNRNHSSESPSI